MEHIGYKVFYKAAFDLQAKEETPSQKKHRCGLIGKEEKPSDLKAVRLFCILAFV